MNKLAVSLVAGVLVACGLGAWKINEVHEEHVTALKEFAEEFNSLHELVKSGMMSKEAALAEYEIIHSRGAERCLANTLDHAATKLWLADIYKVNIQLIETVAV